MGSHTCEHRDVSLLSVGSPTTNICTVRALADGNPSLLEMFVGIICACMPAASHTWQHHLPSYDSFKYHLRARNGTSGLKLGGTNPTPSSFAENNPRDVKTSRGVHEGYVNLDVLGHELPRPVKPLQTFIYSGRPDDLNHDGINLTYEMQQSSASPPPPKRGWTTV